VGYGFDREQEPEILESGPERDRTWLRAGWLRGWLSGQGVPSPDGTRSWLSWGRYRLGRVPRWVVAATAVVVLAGAATALTLGHERRPGAPFLARTIVGPPKEDLQIIPPACIQMVNATNPKPPPGYRIEFGDVAVPPAVQKSPIIPDAPGIRTWAYARKTGFMFLGDGPPATISVPSNWQTTVALGTPSGPASSLFLPSCPVGAQWNTYVTVIYLHSPTACVPLQIQVGGHATTLRFGLGRSCGS
jgi:hypothetical protein